MATSIFEDPSQLVHFSKELANLLYENSNHPKIKESKFHVALFNNLVYWRDHYLKLHAINNEFHQTSEFMKITKDFIADNMMDEFGINRANKDRGSVEVVDSFPISNLAVKQQAKIFKSVLKLDKNFHVYIHGDRSMIERGKDEDGKKYYKLFYERED